jgi:hypothetical protein
MPGYFDQSADDDGDDGIQTLRQKHQQELAYKQQQFQQQQAEKANIHQAAQAARIYQFHRQHGDGPTHELAKGLLMSQGPEHIRGVAMHLRRGGADDTAKVLASAAMQSGLQ